MRMAEFVIAYGVSLNDYRSLTLTQREAFHLAARNLRDKEARQ